MPSDRSIAGGGRIDRVFDELGLATTSAVGFEMGDVALWNLVEEAGTFPTDLRLVTILGMRPEAFVVGIGPAASEATAAPTGTVAGGSAARVPSRARTSSVRSQ